jgi:hypothetical protein
MAGIVRQYARQLPRELNRRSSCRTASGCNENPRWRGRDDGRPSRRVILANGGLPGVRRGGEDRFWIELDRRDHNS